MSCLPAQQTYLIYLALFSTEHSSSRMRATKLFCIMNLCIMCISGNQTVKNFGIIGVMFSIKPTANMASWWVQFYSSVGNNIVGVYELIQPTNSIINTEYLIGSFSFTNK